MTFDRFGRKAVFALVVGSVLSACSPPASSAVPVQAAVPVAVGAPAAPLVQGLPDFTALVDLYGPAVVNVQVTERRETPTQGRADPRRGQPQPQPRLQPRPQQPDQNDPFQDFFRRFGIPNPGGGGDVLPRGGDALPRGNAPPARGEGSGFIVTSDGYIMTNAHVVRGASDVVVKMTDRREYSAKVIGIDDRTDVAVIKIDAKNLPTVRIGDPATLKPGQWVIAIGSPFGMENSVTAGIVSATSRSLPDDPYVPFIQTDVAVNPGNSGGPLFNMQGEVVGINSQIYSQTGGFMGLSFAIPIDVANNVREQLVKDGRVQRGRIGVTYQGVSAAMADAFGLDRPRGAVVQTVEASGPSEKAGVKVGDIILSVDGRTVEHETELPSIISNVKPGKSVKLEVWRDRALKTLNVNVVELNPEGTVASNASGGDNASQAADVLGLSIRPLAPEERSRVSTEGNLVVEDVEGPAQLAGIRPGDIILGVNGTRVKTVAELAAASKRAGKTVALLVQRGEAQVFIPVRIP